MVEREPDANGRLLAAAAIADVVAIEAALADGADPDVRDPAGNPALMLATRAGSADAVRVLIDAEADIDAQDAERFNPLLYASAEGLLEILTLANEAGANPAITNRYGGVALIPASERGHVDIVQYLLTETDVDVDRVNDLGWTALLEAILLSDGGPRHQEIVRLLIEHGADIDLADKDGIRPLAHARSRGLREIAALLEAEGARP